MARSPKPEKPCRSGTAKGLDVCHPDRSFSEWLDGFDAKGVFREAYLEKLSEEFDSFEDLKVRS